MTIDTSTEAVKAQAQFYREYGFPKASDLIDALVAERDDAERAMTLGGNAGRATMEALLSAQSDLAALRAENEVLKRALEPFAKVAECDIGKDEGDDEQFMPFRSGHNRAPKLLVGDLRAAKAALSTKEPNL